MAVTELPIEEIRLGDRHRADMGDISKLAESIETVGLLHPPVVTPDGLLVAGARRLEALRRLGYETVPVTVVPLVGVEVVRGEFDENEVRKDFTPSEKAAIYRALLPAERAKAKERQGRPGHLRSEKFSEHTPSREAAEEAARQAGFSRPTAQRAVAVVEAAEKNPDQYGDIKQEMDTTGKVTPAYEELRRRQTGAPPKKVHTKTHRGRDATEGARRCINALIGLSHTFDALDPSELAPNEGEAAQWESDLAAATSAINRFRKRMKEHTNG